jgi:hypothetical protein
VVNRKVPDRAGHRNQAVQPQATDFIYRTPRTLLYSAIFITVSVSYKNVIQIRHIKLGVIVIIIIIITIVISIIIISIKQSCMLVRVPLVKRVLSLFQTNVISVVFPETEVKWAVCFMLFQPHLTFISNEQFKSWNLPLVPRAKCFHRTHIGTNHLLKIILFLTVHPCQIMDQHIKIFPDIPTA